MRREGVEGPGEWDGVIGGRGKKEAVFSGLAKGGIGMGMASPIVSVDRFRPNSEGGDRPPCSASKDDRGDFWPDQAKAAITIRQRDPNVKGWRVVKTKGDEDIREHLAPLSRTSLSSGRIGGPRRILPS